MADVEEGTIYRVKAELEDDYTSVRKIIILLMYQKPNDVDIR